MKISEKISMDRAGLEKNGPITIVAFGDSVTHGAVGPGEMDYESVYWNRLRKKIIDVSSYVPVNVINAGIGGVSAATSVSRMEQQVFAHSPDLIIICFGLNDVNGELDTYIGALRSMFEKCNERKTDTIFMTPNMLNTYVAPDTAECHLGYAKKTADMQNSGRMDTFMSAAAELAESMGISVCDCYAKWKELSKTEDTTLLLANRINHPTREMHELFASSLFEMILGDRAKNGNTESTMYKEQ